MGDTELRPAVKAALEQLRGNWLKHMSDEEAWLCISKSYGNEVCNEMKELLKDYAAPRESELTNNLIRISQKSFDARPGPRVGDFIRLPDLHANLGKFTRMTYDWGDGHIQTGGSAGGSYYLGSGYLSYSGALDHGVRVDDLVDTGETKSGSVWLFRDGIAAAHCGVHFDLPMRVFELKHGSDISGISELRCPFMLHVVDRFMDLSHGGYRYLITRHNFSYSACKSESELKPLLMKLGLELTASYTDGVASTQPLQYLCTRKPWT